MPNIFTRNQREEADPANAAPETKPPEKSAAELIAESLKPLLEGQAALAEAVKAQGERQASFEQRFTKQPSEADGAPQRTSFFDDEDRAFNERAAGLAMRQLASDARYERDQVFQDYRDSGYGDFLKECRADIDKILEGTSLVDAAGHPLRGNPEYIRNTVDMVIGRMARKANLKFGGKDRGFFTEGASSGTGDSTEAASAQEGLTAGQVKAFKKWGIPLEEGKKTVAKMAFVH
jgi:hypothetical protein